MQVVVHTVLFIHAQHSIIIQGFHLNILVSCANIRINVVTNTVHQAMFSELKTYLQFYHFQVDISLLLLVVLIGFNTHLVCLSARFHGYGKWIEKLRYVFSKLDVKKVSSDA